MAAEKVVGVQIGQAMARLVSLGLKQKQLSGLTSILADVSDQTNSFGITLWELRDFASDNGGREILLVAQWFPGGESWSDRAIPAETSATGRAILDDQSFRIVDDAWNDRSVHPATFLVRNNIQRALICPLEYKSGTKGAITVYRQMDTPVYTEEDGKLLVALTKLLPELVESIRGATVYSLSIEINSILQQAPSIESSHKADRDSVAVLDLICTSVRSHLSCAQVSIFQNESVIDGSYIQRRLARSLAPGLGLEAERGIETAPEFLSAATDAGLPLLIDDLAKGETLSTTSDHAYQAELATLSGDRPLSLIACTLKTPTDGVLGIIVSSTPLQGPAYFGRRELSLLDIVAGQVSQFLSERRSRAALTRENEEWKKLVQALSKINAVVHSELEKQNPSEDQIFARSLTHLHDVIPDASFLDIVILNESGAHPRRFTEKGVKPVEGEITFPIKVMQQLQTGKCVDVPYDALSQPEWATYKASLREGVDQVVLAAITSQDQFGVLEVGGTRGTPLPRHSNTMARLLADQLRLYHNLVRTVGSLKAAKQNDKEMRIQQEQAFMDLEHQIRTPLRHARTRASLLVKIASSTSNEALIRQTLFIRGILRRANRVAGAIRLYAELAKEGEIDVRKKRQFSEEDLRKLLIECAMDNQAISVDERKNLNFRVLDNQPPNAFDLHSLRVPPVFEADEDLLDQAINNILDNAGKYSSFGETVEIAMTFSRAFFHITVSNRGLRLTAGEVEYAKIRGWRSTVAKLTTGEGSGIGLWIVDNIMRAHSGKLVISATNAEGRTEVRLSFPTK